MKIPSFLPALVVLILCSCQQDDSFAMYPNRVNGRWDRRVIKSSNYDVPKSQDYSRRSGDLPRSIATGLAGNASAVGIVGNNGALPSGSLSVPAGIIASGSLRGSAGSGATNPEIQRVQSYTRSNGTAVPEYYRTRTDSSATNNWGSRGNINPRTGARGYR